MINNDIQYKSATPMKQNKEQMIGTKYLLTKHN